MFFNMKICRDQNLSSGKRLQQNSLVVPRVAKTHAQTILAPSCRPSPPRSLPPPPLTASGKPRWSTHICQSRRAANAVAARTPLWPQAGQVV